LVLEGVQEAGRFGRIEPAAISGLPTDKFDVQFARESGHQNWSSLSGVRSVLGFIHQAFRRNHYIRAQFVVLILWIK
jgi:hypothetical protein